MNVDEAAAHHPGRASRMLHAARRAGDVNDEAAATAALFKALGDPTRVRIVNMLAAADDGVCVCDLTPHLGLSQPTVSHHLRKLANAGLLRRRQEGTWAFYSLDRDALSRLEAVATFPA